MFACTSVCLSASLSVCVHWPVCLCSSVCLSVYLYVGLCLSIGSAHLLIHLYVFPSINLSFFSPVCLSVYTSVFPPVCPSVRLCPSPDDCVFRLLYLRSDRGDPQLPVCARAEQEAGHHHALGPPGGHDAGLSRYLETPVNPHSTRYTPHGTRRTLHAACRL